MSMKLVKQIKKRSTLDLNNRISNSQYVDSTHFHTFSPTK